MMGSNHPGADDPASIDALDTRDNPAPAAPACQPQAADRSERARNNKTSGGRVADVRHPPDSQAGVTGDVVVLAPRNQGKSSPPPSSSFPSSPAITHSGGQTATPARVSFDRRELNALLDLYGRRVAEGEWRDYAIDFHTDRAIFSIFRRTSEAPLYRIEKQPRLARRQGSWSVVSAAGLVLKRGNDLSRILAVLEKPLRVVRG